MYLAYYSRVYVNVTTMNIAPDQDNTYISFGPCLSGGNKLTPERQGPKDIYRIRLIAAPLLNRAPGNVESPVFGVFLE